MIPHASRGHITAHIADRVLFFESTGPFDGEIVEAVIRAYRPLLQRLADGGPFAHVSTFHRSMLATPDEPPRLFRRLFSLSHAALA
ncbi:hypothetical protein [Silanimonas sp.]|uniref:hypothetical protein n=1 Tax=Silanimonas sp. TaxID=1929290 RepID=UPI0037C8590B